MGYLEAGIIPHKIIKDGLQRISLYMDTLPHHAIDNLLWLEVEYLPKVNFSIAYDSKHIFLKYRVAEKYIRAENMQTNSTVYRDSCVEFFIAFNDEQAYYNLEFNCAGTVLAGYGKDRNNRELLDVPVVNSIRSYVLMQDNIAQNKNKYWELTLQIPFALFTHNNIGFLYGTPCRVNFYKCGDDLPEPHYLSWNNIPVAEPDFHLPQYFGTAKFI